MSNARITPDGSVIDTLSFTARRKRQRVDHRTVRSYSRIRHQYRRARLELGQPQPGGDRANRRQGNLQGKLAQQLERIELRSQPWAHLHPDGKPAAGSVWRETQQQRGDIFL